MVTLCLNVLNGEHTNVNSLYWYFHVRSYKRTHLTSYYLGLVVKHCGRHFYVGNRGYACLHFYERQQTMYRRVVITVFLGLKPQLGRDVSLVIAHLVWSARGSFFYGTL